MSQNEVVTIRLSPELYKSNYLQWLEETIKCLKTRQLEKVDYENLIEELEDLAKKGELQVCWNRLLDIYCFMNIGM